MSDLHWRARACAKGTEVTVWLIKKERCGRGEGSEKKVKGDRRRILREGGEFVI